MYDEWLTDRSQEARELNSVNSAWSANAVLRIASRRLEFITSTCNGKLSAARAQHAGQSERHFTLFVQGCVTVYKNEIRMNYLGVPTIDNIHAYIHAQTLSKFACDRSSAFRSGPIV